MPALVIGANLPDVDAACLFWLDGVEHLGFRRGITHGPPAMLLLPLMLAGALWGWDRWQAQRGTRPAARLPVSFKWLYALAFIGCLTHPALDWLNVYGIRLLEPFSSRWFYGDTLFIIDVWLWALLGYATWFSLRREKRGGEWQRPARIAITVALAYIGVNGAITASYVARDDDVTGQMVIASPVPLWFWEREMILGQAGRYAIVDPAIESQDLALTRPADDAKFIGVVGDCQVPTVTSAVPWANERSAFLFWSRAPFAERAPDGSVILRDARFYDPRARDRFSVALPEVRCEELPAS